MRAAGSAGKLPGVYCSWITLAGGSAEESAEITMEALSFRKGWCIQLFVPEHKGGLI